MWEEISKTLTHDAQVVALTQDYGNRLAYWGWHNTRNWPYAGDINYHELRGKSFKFGELFSELTRNKQYFLVTDFAELDRQPQLLQQLGQLSVYRQADGYAIYDLSAPMKP